MRALLYRGGKCVGEVEVDMGELGRQLDNWFLYGDQGADRVEIPITDWPTENQLVCEGPVTEREIKHLLAQHVAPRLLKGCHRQQLGRTGKGERKRNRKDRWR